MKVLLSTYGLAALGWVSSFVFLWLYLLGEVDGSFSSASVLLFFLLVAVFSSSHIWAAEKREREAGDRLKKAIAEFASGASHKKAKP